MLQKLSAKFIHTSNPAYVELLKRAGVQAKRLPLFGAIPVAAAADRDWFYAKLAQQGLNHIQADRQQFWLFGIFGTLHPIWPPEPLFSYLEKAATDSGRKIAIVSVGGIGAGSGRWQTLKQQYEARFHFIQVGHQPAEKVSAVLHNLDFGLATTPYDLIGKSATVAAMLEHGLPVIVNRDDIHYENATDDFLHNHPLLIKMDNQLPQRLPVVQRGIPQSWLPQVAEQFLKDLAHAATA